MDWKREFDRVMADPATHFWVKDILNQALQKDPVDGYFDIALIAVILKGRMNEAVGMGE
jgi:uncharacterized protein YfaQ (DUF2300 family)